MSPPPVVASARNEILSALGVGGTGEVYRATDTTLGRQVAIKILPDAFAADPECWRGSRWHQRTVIRQMSADAMTATSYLSFGNVPEWKGVEIKYTRTPT